MPRDRSVRVTAMIPARMGSERLARKNLVLVCGKPLITYAVEAAKASGAFDRIVINSDGAVFQEIARASGVEFYQRPAGLAGSATRSDEVIRDFLERDPADVLAWVNPIAPLQPAEEIRGAVAHFVAGAWDSLVTVRDEQVHCNFRGGPLNYAVDEPFAKTQDLEPVQRFVYSVMMWRRAPFLERYARAGHGLLCGRVCFYPVSQLSAFIVKTEADLRLCEQLLAGRQQLREAPLAYYAVPGGQ